jgi:hypothetical protein
MVKFRLLLLLLSLLSVTIGEKQSLRVGLRNPVSRDSFPFQNNPLGKPDDPSKEPGADKDEIPTSPPTISPLLLDPTSYPTTSNPSISVTPSISPSESPSLFPSVKTDFPISSPTQVPADTALPTTYIEFPTSFPSILPSGIPSISPTLFPTIHTNAPSELPSSKPSIAPTPPGKVGKDWWYTLTASVKLFSSNRDVFDVYDVQEVIDALVYAFEFEFDDMLDAQQSEEIIVVVYYHEFHRRLLLEDGPPNVISLQDEPSNITAVFELKTWCPTVDITSKVNTSVEIIPFILYFKFLC